MTDLPIDNLIDEMPTPSADIPMSEKVELPPVKRGRKKKVVNSTLDAVATATTQETGQPTKPPIGPLKPEHTMAAAAVVGSIELLGRMLGGEEWNMLKDEKDGGVAVFAEYFRVKGITDVPPGIGVLIWSLAYAVTRSQMPVTKTRFQKFKEWILGRLVK